jgi:hypothetical protein
MAVQLCVLIVATEYIGKTRARRRKPTVPSVVRYVDFSIVLRTFLIMQVGLSSIDAIRVK